ncbi:MAG: hypothetical protein II368_01525 [Clostridia bacterium]|nr:hypothetical protein [Clostridia bacterium]
MKYRRLVKTNAKKRRGAAVCVFAVAVCAIFLVVSVFTKKEVAFARCDVYALCFYEGKDASEATLAAQSLTLRGGAGYVQKEGQYRVLGCVYASRERAMDVCRKIVQSGGDCKVIPLTVRAVRLPSKRREEISLFSTLHSLFWEMIDTLSTAFADADRGKERTLILSSLSAFSEKFSALRAETLYQKGLQQGVCVAAVELLSSSAQTLQNLLTEGSLFALSVQIKYAMLQITDEFRAFCENFT